MFQGQINLEPINCSSVCADSVGLHELNNKGGKSISIPWGEIVSVQLGFDFRSERPAIQFIVAVGLVLVGAYAGLLPLIKYLAGFGNNTGPYGPASGVKLILGMAAFIPIGLYLLYSMLQRRYCLRISKIRLLFKALARKNVAQPVQPVKLFNGSVNSNCLPVMPNKLHSTCLQRNV